MLEQQPNGFATMQPAQSYSDLHVNRSPMRVQGQASSKKQDDNLRWNSILLAMQQQQPNTKLTNNILSKKGRVRSVYNPLMPKENYWYHKNRMSKDLYMESEKEEDSFTQGMDELNNYADRIFREDLRAIR